jgi:hypothetical protein
MNKATKKALEKAVIISHRLGLRKTAKWGMLNHAQTKKSPTGEFGPLDMKMEITEAIRKKVVYLSLRKKIAE